MTMIMYMDITLCSCWNAFIKCNNIVAAWKLLITDKHEHAAAIILFCCTQLFQLLGSFVTLVTCDWVKHIEIKSKPLDLFIYLFINKAIQTNKQGNYKMKEEVKHNTGGSK